MRTDDLLGTRRASRDTPDTWLTAGTDDENVAFIAPIRCKVTAITFVTNAAITADATDYATLSAQNKGDDGTGTTEIGTWAFDTATTDDLAAFDAVALTLSSTAANLILAEGDVVTIKKVTPGTGMAIDGHFEFEFEPVGS